MDWKKTRVKKQIFFNFYLCKSLKKKNLIIIFFIYLNNGEMCSKGFVKMQFGYGSKRNLIRNYVEIGSHLNDKYVRVGRPRRDDAYDDDDVGWAERWNSAAPHPNDITLTITWRRLGIFLFKKKIDY